MSACIRLYLPCLFLCAASLSLHAQCPVAPVSNDHFLEIHADNGSPVLAQRNTSLVFPNDTDVLLRVTVNPFAFKCSVTTTTQPYQETAIASFLAMIGGVASPPASTPAPGSTAGAKEDKVDSPTACYTDTAQSKKVVELGNLAKAIPKALASSDANRDSTLNLFDTGVQSLRVSTTCSDTVAKAQEVAGLTKFVIKQVELGGGQTLPLDQAIDSLASGAQTLLPDLTSGLSDACKKQAKVLIDEDTAFLSAVAHGTTAIPAAADQWRTHLATLVSANASLMKGQQSLRQVLGNRQNFAIDTQLRGNQQAITVKVSCAAVPQQEVVISEGSSQTTAKPQAPIVSTSNTDAKPTTSDWTRDFKFGPGPRFILSGGLVISPLASVTYSTSANPGGSSPANIIIFQSNSGTRTLPVGMLSARLFDLLPSNPKRDWIIPNYLSVGITAKSDAPKGTAIEYIFGPSWSFAARQLFITAGAYAGQQQRLQGGLYAGQTTGLSSANLPISQRTVWKPGFAITWAPAGK